MLVVPLLHQTGGYFADQNLLEVWFNFKTKPITSSRPCNLNLPHLLLLWLLHS